MYHNSHLKIPSRSKDYVLPGNVDSAHDPQVMSTSRAPYEVPISTPPIPAPRVQYDPLPKPNSTPPLSRSQYDAAVSSTVVSNPVRTLYNNPVINPRPQYKPLRPRRPASVHEQDLRGTLMVPVKCDSLDKSTGRSNRGYARPLSLHEQQHPSLTFAQTDEQNNILFADYLRQYTVSSSSSIGNSNQNKEDKAVSKLKAEFQNISNDRDILQEELRKAQSKLENHRTTGMDVGAGVGIQVSARERGLSKDYDHLKTQCDQTMTDLQELKKQQLETSHKHEMAVKEAEVMRNSYKAMKEKNEALMAEIASLTGQCHESRVDKDRLSREVEDLQKLREEDKKEIAEMRKHQRDVMSESGSSEFLNMFDTTIGKYESLKQEFDNMRRNYADNLALLSSAESKVDLLQDEKKRLQSGNEELNQENSELQKTQKRLEKHFTSMIQKSQNEVSKMKLERDKLKQEILDLKNTLARTHESSEKMGRFRKERDAVLHEYSLVMDERNTVYKEMDQLEEKLTSSQRQLEGSAKENKTISEQLETLKREIASALQDRDRAMKEMNELKEKYSSTVEGIKQEAEKRIERERSSRDGSDTSSKDIATAREIDGLRRELERVKAELVDTQNEVVLAKNRRDWVFCERDKIVQERESIRTLCDKLRRERDSAITQFMEAVKDSDELKTSKAEALRQLKETQEKYEALLEKMEKESGERLDTEGYNHSKDSAIDADLSEWHTETVHIDMSASPGDLGFELGPARDDSTVLVTSVRPGTMAFEKLRVNDVVVMINNMDVDIMNTEDVLHSARHSGNLVSVSVKRKKPVGGRGVRPVVIQLHSESDPGIHVASGMYVSVINPGSPAAREGTLAVGDRILAVNGLSVENLALSDVVKRIQDSHHQISLNILKFPSSPALSSLLMSSQGSSGQMMSDLGSPERGCSSPTSNLWQLTNSLDNSAKAVDTPLRSSGSQTDSLDSPPTSARTRNTAQRGGLYMKSQSADKTQQSKDSLFNRAIKVISKPFQTDRGERCRSMMYDESNISDQSVIDDLNGIVNQYSQQLQQEEVKPKPTKRRLAKGRDSGGTWPRCRPFIDGDQTTDGFQPIPTRRVKERPALKEGIYHYPVSPNSTSHEQDLCRVPPTPPERNDSFKRSASIKHSPQSSDSTVKSVHLHTTASSSPTKHYQSVATSLQQPSANSDGFPPPLPSQPPRKKSNMEESSSLSNAAHGYQVNNVSSYSSTGSHTNYTGSSTDMAHTLPDFTVVSGVVTGDMSRYRRPRARPTTAPPRNSREVKTSENQSVTSQQNTAANNIGGFQPSVKSSFNDVGRPSYPARPPPPTNLGTNTLLGYSSSSNTGPTTSLASPQTSNAPTTPGSHGNSGPPMVSPRDKPPSGHFAHIQAHRHGPHHPYPTGTNHSGPSYSVRTSHTFNTSSPINIQPPPPQGFSPPPAYHSTGSGSYNVRNNRLNTPSPSPSQQSSSMTYDNSTNSEGEFSSQARVVPPRSAFIPGHPEQVTHIDGITTLPRRMPYRQYPEQRIRIPSNNSVISRSTQSSVSRISTSSFERMSISDRASPISPFPFHHTTGDFTSNSLPKQVTDPLNLRPGTTRSITIEKGSVPLGIQIDTGRKGAIFVSSISENSLASKAGLQVGDQLLEVCGINMRKATRDQVASVLRQVGASINMLVQYNPDNLKSTAEYSEGDSSSSDSSDSEPEPPEGTHARSGSQRSASHTSQHSGSGMSGSGRSSIRRPQPQKCNSSDTTTASVTSETPTSMSPVHARTKGEDNRFSGQIRFVFYNKCNPEDHVGFEMVGGNAVGIFVDRVHPSGIVPTGPGGLNKGDQILEYNGVSFRDLTAEQASLEVSKPVESIAIRAQYNYGKYKMVENQPGDSIFVKAMFDYAAEKDGELSFKRDDILYVEDTMYNGKQGVWKVWLLDENGVKIQCGTVPSKNKLEDEYVLRRSISDIGEDELKGSRRGSTSATRRSFFRRKKHHRNNSKDSREFNSFSDASINSDYEDNSLWTYERVERLDNKVWRPVMILGPLAESLINKVTSESPDRYCRCLPEKVQTSISTLQAGQHDGIFIDFKALSDGHFECITVNNIKSIMDNNRHGMLNVSADAIERLHKVHIYPIVLFIKHESAKQIREFRDSRFLPEKLSSKLAKECFQVNKDIEHNYRRYFSDIIQGETLAHQCIKIKNVIEKEQKKTVWAPSGSL